MKEVSTIPIAQPDSNLLKNIKNKKLTFGERLRLIEELEKSVENIVGKTVIKIHKED